jgi:hypothetical protein
MTRTWNGGAGPGAGVEFVGHDHYVTTSPSIGPNHSMKARIAVLGCGYWGSNHIRTLKALGALHSVSDLNAARAEGFAAEQDCLAIAPDELAEHGEIDAIVMALPPQFHAEMPRSGRSSTARMFWSKSRSR